MRLAELEHRATTQTAVVPDMSALLRIINSQKQTPLPPPPAPPVVPASGASGLEAIFAQYANQNQQQAQQVPQMQMPQQQPQVNLQALLAGIQPQAQQTYAAPPVALGGDLQALIASLGAQPAPQVAQMHGFGYLNQYQNPNGNERKRQYDNNDEDHGRKRPRADGEPKKKVIISSNIADTIVANGCQLQYFGPPRLPCKFWQEGKCRKGDECNYLHDQPREQ